VITIATSNYIIAWDYEKVVLNIAYCWVKAQVDPRTKK